MTESLVLYEVKDKIAFITLNRPDKLNAMNRQLLVELGQAWKDFEKDDDAFVAILSAAGRDFSSGRDLKEKAAGPDNRVFNEAVSANGVSVFKPIIGAVHGRAIGAGFGLVQFGCDLVVASEDAQFRLPEASVGSILIKPYVPYMLFRRNLEFMLTAEWIDAQTAYEWGLVNKVVPVGEHINEAIKLAEKIKKNAPLTLRVIKYGQYRAIDDATRKSDRIEQYEYDKFLKPQAESEDTKEGILAFMEKREPRFKGK